MYVGNLHETLTESDLGELSDLRTTNYLVDNCSIEMSKLQWKIQWSCIYFNVCCHVCDKLVKLHGLEFHGRKIIIDEAKTPHKT